MLFRSKGGLEPGTGTGKAHAIRYLPNMEVISIESLMGENKDAATIWRGPLKIGVIRQFISDIEWSDCHRQYGWEPCVVVENEPMYGDMRRPLM